MKNTCFFNKLFPQLFNASYERLQCRFTTYFKTERKLRWDFQCNIQKVEARFDTLVNKPVGEGGGCGLNRFLVVPAKFDKHDTSVIRNDLKELTRVREKVRSLREDLVKTRREQILNEEGVVKRWTEKEQEPYNRHALDTCEKTEGL